jgi:hypothetical protein
MKCLPHILSAALLLWGYNEDNPYGYYIFLRWVICPVFAYLALQAYAASREPWVWIYGIIAALYNPIATAHLGRDTWEIVNALTIGLLIFNVYQIRKTQKQ